MQKTILIAEDYADVRIMMKMLVCSFGYEVIEAADGLEAVAKASQHKPDLILMDISMPFMDGLNATRTIRKSELDRRIPIIAVTAFDQTFHQQALEAGCDQVIGKPVDFANFEKFLKQHFDH